VDFIVRRSDRATRVLSSPTLVFDQYTYELPTNSLPTNLFDLSDIQAILSLASLVKAHGNCLEYAILSSFSDLIHQLT
jgi:hypothetical protein